MRCILATLLLLLLLSNCVQGVGVRCAGAQSRCAAAPSPSEQALLSQLQYALEQDQALKTVDRAFNGRRGWAYPADFVYAATVECDTVYFIVTQEPQEGMPYAIVYTRDVERPAPAEAPTPAGFQNWYLPQALSWPALAQPGIKQRSVWPRFIFGYSSPRLWLLAPPPEQVAPLLSLRHGID